MIDERIFKMEKTTGRLSVVVSYTVTRTSVYKYIQRKCVLW